MWEVLIVTYCKEYPGISHEEWKKTMMNSSLLTEIETGDFLSRSANQLFCYSQIVFSIGYTYIT